MSSVDLNRGPFQALVVQEDSKDEENHSLVDEGAQTGKSKRFVLRCYETNAFVEENGINLDPFKTSKSKEMKVAAVPQDNVETEDEEWVCIHQHSVNDPVMQAGQRARRKRNLPEAPNGGSLVPEAKNGGTLLDDARAPKPLGRLIKNFVTGSNRLATHEARAKFIEWKDGNIVYDPYQLTSEEAVAIFKKDGIMLSPSKVTRPQMPHPSLISGATGIYEQTKSRMAKQEREEARAQDKKRQAEGEHATSKMGEHQVAVAQDKKLGQEDETVLSPETAKVVANWWKSEADDVDDLAEVMKKLEVTVVEEDSGGEIGLPTIVPPEATRSEERLQDDTWGTFNWREKEDERNGGEENLKK
jgi:hypothetical protein